MTDGTDILICFSPVEEEYAALASVFPALKAAPGHLSDGSGYWSLLLKQPKEQQIKIQFIQLKNQGVLHACAITTKAAVEKQPSLIISFGIAGGFIKTDELELGDVICANAIYYYEPAKETEKPINLKLLRELLKINSPLKLPQFISYTTGIHILKICYEAASDWKEPNSHVRFGPLASGEKLIASKDSPSRKVIVNIQRKMLGVEMEAAGIGAAAGSAPLSFKRVEVLAIKGVSDDATLSKQGQSRHRRIAADNAAKYLSVLLHRLALNSSLFFVPPPNPQLARKARKLGNSCFRALQPFIVPNSINKGQCDQLFTKDRMPKAYYHWRVQNEYIHWVDIYYLRALNALQSCGISSHLIISDRSGGSKLVREGIELQARQILSDCEITWEDELDGFRTEYITHANTKGFDRFIRKAISEAPDYKSISDHKRVAEEVLQFVIWDAREVDSILYLTWSKLMKVPSVMQHLLDVDCVIASMPDLMLGGTLAKEGEPGLRLIIDPPDYSNVLQWLSEKPPLDQIRDFVGYMSVALKLPKKPNYESLSFEVPKAIMQLLTDKTYQRWVGDVLNLLDQLNVLHFGSMKA